MSGKTKDFYSVLGLHRDCTSAELRAAYKKLALRWHPDKWVASGNNSRVVEEVKKKFQAIHEAYAVLSDENKRFLYDAGVYDTEDDEGMEDFLDEMAEMMNDSRERKGTSESFEQLQELFMNMFEADLNNLGKNGSTSNADANCRAFFEPGLSHQGSMRRQLLFFNLFSFSSSLRLHRGHQRLRIIDISDSETQVQGVGNSRHGSKARKKKGERR